MTQPAASASEHPDEQRGTVRLAAPASIQQPVSASDRLWVLYDAECPVCTGSVGWALRRDRDRRLQPIASDSAQARSLLEARQHERTRAEIHVVSERDGVLTGADAIAAILRRLPRWGWAGSIMGSRLVLPIARPVYRAFAARRRRIAAACGWKPRPIETAPR